MVVSVDQIFVQILEMDTATVAMKALSIPQIVIQSHLMQVCVRAILIDVIVVPIHLAAIPFVPLCIVR